MIKANELRLGNLVKDKLESFGTIVMVGDINTGAIHSTESKKIYIQDLEPIPLTEEWLKKFGFSLTGIINDVSYGYVVICNNADLDGKGARYFFQFGNKQICKLEHVHQLQNLYFALTGEELKIEEDVTSE